MTTLPDPVRAPAEAPAALHHERRDIEGALDGLKTHPRGPRVVPRGKTPELVRQEFRGLLLGRTSPYAG